ncbi:MAG: ribosome-binding factor A [Bacteroidales bacterium]
MESTRQQKVSRLLQKDLSSIFQSEVQNLFGHVMITVTKVTKDLSIAKVYLSLFGTNDKATSIKNIKVHGGRKLDTNWVRELETGKAIPELQFF